MKNKRKYSLTPKSITNFASIEREFLTWWISLQPKARHAMGVDLNSSDNTLASVLIKAAKVEDDGWSRLSVGGKNGLFLVFLMLVWLKRLAKTHKEHAIVDIALEDVCWALDKVLEDLKTCENAEGSKRPMDADTMPGPSSKQLCKGRKRERYVFIGFAVLEDSKIFRRQSEPEPNTRRTRARK